MFKLIGAGWLTRQDLDPRTRWTPRQAAQHPFVTNKRFSGPFQPPPDPPKRPAPEAAAGSAPGPGGSPYSGGGGGGFMYAPPMAAGMATSPEAHAAAHAAALAALQVRAGARTRAFGLGGPFCSTFGTCHWA